MMTILGWLQLVIILFAAGALAGAGLVALGLPSALARLEATSPRARFVLLGALALLPVALGCIVVMIAFLPSVFDALGLISDHCNLHCHHIFHLCFVHGTPPPISPIISAGCAIFALWIIATWGREFVGIYRASQWSQQLKRVGRYDTEIGGWMLTSERPIALAIGYLRPKFCISQHLRDLLPTRQLEAVIAHEKAHIRHRDALVKFGVRLGAKLHFSPMRERLLSQLDLACEQACDESAADAVGDRVTVAEAIVAMKRACEQQPTPALALGFAAHALESRVRGVLDGNWKRPNWRPFMAIAGAAAGGLLLFHDRLHHGVETLTFLAF